MGQTVLSRDTDLSKAFQGVTKKLIYGTLSRILERTILFQCYCIPI